MSAQLAGNLSDQLLNSVVRTDQMRLAIHAKNLNSSVVTREFHNGSEMCGHTIHTNGQHSQLSDHFLAVIHFGPAQGEYTINLLHHSDSPSSGHVTLKVLRDAKSSEIRNYSNGRIASERQLTEYWPEGAENFRGVIAAIEVEMVRYGISKAMKVSTGQGVHLT